VIETFNAYEYDGLHEIGIYHVVASDDELAVSDSPFKGKDPAVDLTFRWIPLDELDRHKIYPRVLKELLGNLPDELKHYTNNDKEA
jgi:hypothetical protein